MLANNHTLTRAKFGSHHKTLWKCLWREYELSLCASRLFSSLLLCFTLVCLVCVCGDSCKCVCGSYTAAVIWSESAIGVTAVMWQSGRLDRKSRWAVLTVTQLLHHPGIHTGARCYETCPLSSFSRRLWLAGLEGREGKRFELLKRQSTTKICFRRKHNCKSD